MKKLFATYKEYLSAVIIMIRDYSPKNIHRVKMAINVCESLIDDRDKMYRMNDTLRLCFWDIREAIEMGFSQYLKQELKLSKEIVEYHKYNCEGEPDCKVCQVQIKIKDQLGINNEGKKSKLHAVQ